MLYPPSLNKPDRADARKSALYVGYLIGVCLSVAAMAFVRDRSPLLASVIELIGGICFVVWIGSLVSDIVAWWREDPR